MLLCMGAEVGRSWFTLAARARTSHRGNAYRAGQAHYAREVLVGRGSEQRRIDDVLDAARRGRSGALLIRGEAGVGKTALLEYARRRGSGMSIASSIGIESESKLAFAGLAALLRPFQRHLPALVDRQRAALEAALALGPPVESDRLAVAAATLAVLAAAAEERPLLAVVDDAHWLDAASREAILFTARRLREEGACLLLASRDEEPDALGEEGIPQLEIRPLARHHAIELVNEGADIAPAVAAQIAAATGGNPLALQAAVELLTDDQRRGRVPLEAPLPVGSAEASFGRTAARLAPATRKALLVVCADGAGRHSAVVAALRCLGVDPQELGVAEGAQLITRVGDQVMPRHPLVRSAVYHGADKAERRAAHAALASAYKEQADADRRAWHLSAAATGPDETVATALEAAAGRAIHRQGYAAAADALARAAELSMDGASAARRLIAAARGAELAGQPERVLALAAASAGRTADPLLEADLVLLRGRASRDRDPGWAAAALEQAAQRIADLDPEREARLLLEAAMAAERLDIDRAVHLAQHAATATREAGLDPTLVDLVHARLEHYLGRPTAQSTAVVVPRLDDLAEVEIALWLAASNPVPDRTQHAFIDHVVAAAREKSALGLLAEALLTRAGNQFYLGDWIGAVADNQEVIDLAAAVGRPAIGCEAHGNLARIRAFQGDIAACQAELTEYLRLSRTLGMVGYEDFAGVYLGELALSRGDPREAVRRLAPTAMARTISRARAGLIEAYARIGAVEEARQSLADLEVMVDRTASPSGQVFVARLHGLLSDDAEDAVSAFDKAVDAARALDWPLETARTELLYGERLRRDRRRREARAHLADAAEIFEALGARPWADRARAELSATGEHRALRSAQTLADLTPQELQMARIVAQGATNREAAAQLFVSPKTVEAHLGAIYRKLSVRSRTELAARLAAAAPSGLSARSV